MFTFIWKKVPENGKKTLHKNASNHSFSCCWFVIAAPKNNYPKQKPKEKFSFSKCIDWKIQLQLLGRRKKSYFDSVGGIVFQIKLDVNCITQSVRCSTAAAAVTAIKQLGLLILECSNRSSDTMHVHFCIDRKLPPPTTTYQQQSVQLLETKPLFYCEHNCSLEIKSELVQTLFILLFEVERKKNCAHIVLKCAK